MVVDVRERKEYEGEFGHISGSVNVPLAELPGQSAALREKGRSLVMVCRTDKRSAKAAAILQAQGLRDVVVLQGGMEAWKRDEVRA